MSNVNESQQLNEERKKITLVKPENTGETNKYTAAANTDIVLDFNTGDATISKSDNGENLVFTFTDADGKVIASIVVEGFYKVYSANSLPTFLIPNGNSGDTIPLTAEAFFNDNKDLLPASGNNNQQIANDPTGTEFNYPSLTEITEVNSTALSGIDFSGFTAFHQGASTGGGSDKVTYKPSNFNTFTASRSTSPFPEIPSNETDAMVAYSINKNNIITKNVGADTLVIKTSRTQSMFATNDGKNEISTGDDNDSITLKGAMMADAKGTNIINAGNDNDSITLKDYMHATNGGTNTINAGNDNDSITLNGLLSATNGVNTINGGAGDDDIKVTSSINPIGAFPQGKNIINLDEGADKLQINGTVEVQIGGENIFNGGDDNDFIWIEGNFLAIQGGKNTINGGDDNDFIWIEGNFLAIQGGKNTINGGADDDLIKLSNSGLSFKDVFIDGGENASDNTVEMDVLLTNVNNLQSIRDAISNKTIANIEVAINGDVQGESVQEVLGNLGVTQNGDKLTFNNPTDWTTNKNSGVTDYTEYTKTENGETITLLIQTGLINT